MAADLGTIRGSVSLDIRKAVAGYAALRAQNQRTVYALREPATPSPRRERRWESPVA